jgi:hypothetical protein
MFHVEHYDKTWVACLCLSSDLDLEEIKQLGE